MEIIGMQKIIYWCR